MTELDTSIVELKWLKAEKHLPVADGIYLVSMRIRLPDGYKEVVDFGMYEDGKWFGEKCAGIEVTAFAETPRYPKELFS